MSTRTTALHTVAITVAILSGTYALVALVAGSPLEFGVAVALCGAWWIAAHFIEWTGERERATRRRAASSARLNPGSGPSHVVFVGAGRSGDYRARPAPPSGTGLAA